jgi:hypothetical protein
MGKINGRQRIEDGEDKWKAEDRGCGKISGREREDGG